MKERCYPVTNIQRFSTHDGPGIRTTVFFKGCPLDCFWCHNPETKSPKEQILFISKSCISCGACIKVCKNDAQNLDETGIRRFRVENCKACLECVKVCPSGALIPASKEMTSQEILSEVMKDIAFYGDEGGITLSGGEPMAQKDGCLEILKGAKERGLHTAVETCGYFEPKLLQKCAPFIDLFLWDIKDGNIDRHILNTGKDHDLILSNLYEADRLAVPIILRCILIAGLNMERGHYDFIADTAKSLSNCIGVELLPYHPAGGSKNVQLGYDDTGNKVLVPDSEDISKARNYLISKGIAVK